MLLEDESVTSYDLETEVYKIHSSVAGVAANKDLSKELILNCCYGVREAYDGRLWWFNDNKKFEELLEYQQSLVKRFS